MMRFSREYRKLKENIFTTIRKNSKGVYDVGRFKKVVTPKQEFGAYIIGSRPLKKAEITEELAQSDADCSRVELIKKLDGWYGKDFDDFVLLTLERNGGGDG